MATAEALRTSADAPEPRQLWNGRKLPYIRVSGPVNSGKSLFSLSIDDNVFDQDKPTTTVVWDLEGSTEPYEDQLNFERRDLLAMVRERVGGKAYKPIDVYTAWVEDLATLPLGKYAVGVVDPFTDVETGLVEWVRANPGKFGRTATQYSSASSMFLWPDVKAWAKQLLMSQLRPRFQSFVTTHHMKAKWEGQRKTNETIAEGLDVLERLATLHIELNRTPPVKGAKAPRVPRGEVKKERIIDVTTGMILPVLPPVIPQCTPNAIRQYILHPADYDNLKPEEQALDHSMTADQKLMVQVAIAEANRDSAQAQLASQQAVIGMPPAVKTETYTTTETTVKTTPAIIDPANFYAPETTQAATPVAAAPVQQAIDEVMAMTAEQFTELKSLWKASGYPPADFIRQYIAPHGTQDPSQLTKKQAESVIQALKDKIAGPTPHDGAREWAEKYKQTRDEMMAENGGNVTNAQLQRMQALFQRLGAEANEMSIVAAEYKVASFKHLTLDQADEIIDKLLKVELGISQPGANRQPGDESENEIKCAFNGKGGSGQAAA
jgi:hypothetical protein